MSSESPWAQKPRRLKPPGADNPRVVDTYSVRTKLRMLTELRRRIKLFRSGGHQELFPVTLQVQTHTDCNSRCRICPHDQTMSVFPSVSMDPGLYEKIARECAEVPELASFSLVLQNEPLMDVDLGDKIRLFQKLNEHDIIVFIVTNGTLLTAERADDLLDAGLDMLHISVNGWGPEDYEYLNRGKRFHLFQENLESFLERDLSKVGLNLSFVTTGKYEKELAQAVKYWRGRGLRVHVHGLSNRAGLVDEDVMADFQYVAEQQTLRTRVLKTIAHRLIPCCPYAFFQCSILANGEMIICTHDWGRKTVVGDVNQQSIREIWNGDTINEVRQKLLDGRADEIGACTDCTVYEELSFV